MDGEKIPDEKHEILPGGRSIGEGRVLVQIVMIEPLDDLLAHQSVQCRNSILAGGRHASDSDQDHIIMAMPVRIVAFAERRPVLFQGKVVTVQTMRGAEPIPSRDSDLFHHPGGQ
jgi:hypothetical protein